MPDQKKETIQRKKDHIQLCLNDDVGFSYLTNGLENYYFEHNAITEVQFDKIDLTTKFFGHKISYPFLISCMTGGTSEAEKINESLAIVVNQLNIPIGVGSQRQALESDDYHTTYATVKKNAKDVPILANIGAAQVASIKEIKPFQKIVDLVEASALVIHVNPLQEVLQKSGEPNFTGLLKRIEILVNKLKVPIIVKEVGSGISRKSAKQLLEVGIEGIDVAGAGGTSWSQVELKRNKQQDEYFRNWGLPTSYCLREVNTLKKKYSFTLISSGGIYSGIEIAKSIALGADIAASARPLLQSILKSGVDGTIKLIDNWFKEVRKIMYLTGSKNIKALSKQKLIRKSELY
ncbi:MAG: type 2 isopentenyl-diphosphate Delta-isomerase [Melioribacteraceae bacterium]|nr:type 2 isopentenyl-diphosphate Delta-isomerase [Melioribacteraceae bacterium]